MEHGKIAPRTLFHGLGFIAPRKKMALSGMGPLRRFFNVSSFVKVSSWIANHFRKLHGLTIGTPFFGPCPRQPSSSVEDDSKNPGLRQIGGSCRVDGLSSNIKFEVQPRRGGKGRGKEGREKEEGPGGLWGGHTGGGGRGGDRVTRSRRERGLRCKAWLLLSKIVRLAGRVSAARRT